jgi:glycosyltransferase involved in cell wall biosynthesis
MNTKISVVTVSFNQAKFLRRCIESVLVQKDERIEYIVVDPGSTDGSREIIAEYASSIDTLILDKDTGPANGLNTGFSKATGDIFYYINSDDCVMSDAFTRATSCFDNDPDLGVLYGNGVIIDQDDHCLRQISSSFPLSEYRYMCGASVILQQATFIRSDMFWKASGFNEENFSCWDGELVSDLLQLKVKFQHIDDLLGAFRIYPGSITGSGDNSVRYRQDKARIFREAYNRDPCLFDSLAKLFFRMEQSFWRVVR